MEHDELLLLHDATVVALLGLLLVLLPNLEHLLVGEADAVQPLEGIVLGIAQPVGGRMAGGRKGLDLAGVGDVGSLTEIDEVAALVHGGAAAVGDLGGNDGLLEGIAGEELQGLVLGNDQTLELLLGLDDLVHLLLDGLVVVVLEGAVSAGAHVGIVVEAAGQRRTDGQAAAVQMLQRLTEHVGRGMPKHRLGVGVGVELEQFQSGDVADEGTGEIPQHRLHLGFGGISHLFFAILVVRIASAFAHEDVTATHPILGGIVILHIIGIGNTGHNTGIGQTLGDARRDGVRAGRPGLERFAGLLVFG
mmetsp:Transcript_34439/g.101217  ORF Transcript_34439/g.101217 Transcript_34439/m.101217 type:complete len:305 (-) Transcript_34439:285-1199(-)